MSIVVEAPNPELPPGPSLFLAGGITGCRDWQRDAISALADTDITIFNPRRAVWPSDPKEVDRQIAWERERLNYATLISFWFTPETICPITLLELGYSLEKSAEVAVGCAPEYSRKKDVESQLHLTYPAAAIDVSLDRLCERIKSLFEVKVRHG